MRRSAHRFSSVVALLLLSAMAGSVSAQTAAPKANVPAKATGEWPQFLGPDRNGISSETKLLSTWPAAGPKELWRVPGGIGMSGVSISRGKALTLVQKAGQQTLVALNAQTGKTEWQRDIASAYRNQMGDGPRATPTIVGDQVFVLTGDGTLADVNFADGKPLWSKQVYADLGGQAAEYGIACSPLVVGEQVLVTVGTQQGTVAAFNTKTGKLAWSAGSDAAGYSSPALLTVGGRPQIVVFTGGSVLGLAPQTGKVLWRHPYETNYECNIATPIAVDDQVFISAGENHGSVLLSLKPAGETYEVTEVWSSFGPKSVLRNEWQTSVLVDGYLYGFDNVGGAGPVTHLTCVDAKTGERAWQQLRFGKGNLIYADGKLWISTMNGELVVVRATPDKFAELGRKVVLGSTRQGPALANGLLYLRDDKEIVCLDVR